MSPSCPSCPCNAKRPKKISRHYFTLANIRLDRSKGRHLWFCDIYMCICGCFQSTMLDHCRFALNTFTFSISVSNPFKTCIKSTTNKAPWINSLYCPIDYSCNALYFVCFVVHSNYTSAIICQIVVWWESLTQYLLDDSVLKCMLQNILRDYIEFVWPSGWI